MLHGKNREFLVVVYLSGVPNHSEFEPFHGKYGKGRGSERRNRQYNQWFTGIERCTRGRTSCIKTAQTQEKRDFRVVRPCRDAQERILECHFHFLLSARDRVFDPGVPWGNGQAGLGEHGQVRQECKCGRLAIRRLSLLTKMDHFRRYRPSGASCCTRVICATQA
jgi:hypothetical protein